MKICAIFFISAAGIIILTLSGCGIAKKFLTDELAGMLSANSEHSDTGITDIPDREPEEPEPEPMRLIWDVEPKYTEVMNLWWAGRIIFDGFELDLETGEISKWDGSDYPTGGIPAPMEWLYDESNNFYGYYGTNEEYSPSDFKMFTHAAFVKMLEEMYWYSPDITDSLRAFRKIDASKVKQAESEWFDSSVYEYDLSEAYIGDKFAVAYGMDFVTDFIFDYEVWKRTNSPIKNFIAVKSGGKWGVINKNGDIAVPFELDDIIFSGEDTAFALYNGKYGILEIK